MDPLLDNGKSNKKLQIKCNYFTIDSLSNLKANRVFAPPTLSDLGPKHFILIGQTIHSLIIFVLLVP